MKFGVQASPLTGVIHVGRLNKAQTNFADKETGTDMVLAAVGQYVQQNFSGGMVADFPGLGFVLEVQVRPIIEPNLPPVEGSDESAAA